MYNFEGVFGRFEGWETRAKCEPLIGWFFQMSPGQKPYVGVDRLCM